MPMQQLMEPTNTSVKSYNSFYFDDAIIDQFLKNKLEEKNTEKSEVLEKQVACEICGKVIKIYFMKAHLKSARRRSKRKTTSRDKEVWPPERAKIYHKVAFSCL